MRQLCEKLAAEGKPVPTLFEITTGVAFHYFYEKQVDVLILEVGLGGRFDATNVVPHPLLSLIMSISIDHTDFLGDTIEKIAMEKSGIIKKNCPVVLYSQAELVYNIIKDAAARMDAPFYCLNDAKIRVASQTLEGTVFSVKLPCGSGGLPCAEQKRSFDSRRSNSQWTEKCPLGRQDGALRQSAACHSGWRA